MKNKLVVTVRDLLYRVKFNPYIMSAVLLLIGAVTFCDDAWGRAGGGNSFGGGSGGGSYGGSSGGGGDGLAFYFLIQLVIRYPLIGIPILIVVIYLMYKGSQQAKEVHTSATLRRGMQRNVRAEHDNSLSQIKRQDPDFSFEIFTSRVQNAFIKSQNAWCAQDITKIRPFVSDGIYQRWNIQLAEQKNSGVHDKMENINVFSVLLDNYEICGNTEEMTVRINASAIDYQISLKTGKLIHGSKEPESFVEYWTFLRRKGAKSIRDKDGLMEGHCPNCGSPVGINENAICANCNALLRSGEYDWVLSEITQEAAYSRQSSASVTGLQTLQEEDPQLSPRMIEDRASVIFWRWAFAGKLQKTDDCRGCCTAEFIESLKKSIIKQPGQFYANCAVGAVDLLGITPGEDYNTAVIEITWSGIKTITDENGKTRKGDQAIYRHLFALKRKCGVKSIKANGVGSAHCPNCGAPESATDNGQCAYCQFLLNDGSSQWVLDDIYTRSSSAGQELIATLRQNMSQVSTTRSAPESDNLSSNGFNMSAYALMAWLCKLAASDGEISDSELKVLNATAKARNLPQLTIDHMLQAAIKGNLDAPEPSDLQEAKLWLEALARLALADGKVSREEKEMMLAAGRKLNFSDFDIDKIIKQQKSQMLRQLRSKK